MNKRYLKNIIQQICIFICKSFTVIFFNKTKRFSFFFKHCFNFETQYEITQSIFIVYINYIIFCFMCNENGFPQKTRRVTRTCFI